MTPDYGIVNSCWEISFLAFKLSLDLCWMRSLKQQYDVLLHLCTLLISVYGILQNNTKNMEFSLIYDKGSLWFKLHLPFTSQLFFFLFIQKKNWEVCRRVILSTYVILLHKICHMWYFTADFQQVYSFDVFLISFTFT